MIPKAYITAWREHAPWLQDIHVEQDLIICRALIELFNHPKIADSIAFRGGTALYKLFIHPPSRYSEDIDLVQIRAEPIGELFTTIKKVLEPFLGKAQWKLNEGRAILFYKFQPESIIGSTQKVKIEINTREHFTLYGLCEKEFAMESRWYSGNTKIKSYQLEELIGTKLRALYQRKKGRDLFDLWQVLQYESFDPQKAVTAFQYYMNQEKKPVTRAMFEKNLAEKLGASHFFQDIGPFLAPHVQWDFQQAGLLVQEKFLALLPGEKWAGKS